MSALLLADSMDLSEYEIVGFYQGLPLYAHADHRRHPVSYGYRHGLSIAILQNKESKMASPRMMMRAGEGHAMPMTMPPSRPKPKRRKVKGKSKVAGKSSRPHGR